MPGAPSSFLFLVRPRAPSSILAPGSDAIVTSSFLFRADVWRARLRWWWVQCDPGVGSFLTLGCPTMLLITKALVETIGSDMESNVLCPCI